MEDQEFKSKQRRKRRKEERRKRKEEKQQRKKRKRDEDKYGCPVVRSIKDFSPSQKGREIMVVGRIVEGEPEVDESQIQWSNTDTARASESASSVDDSLIKSECWRTLPFLKSNQDRFRLKKDQRDIIIEVDEEQDFLPTDKELR